MTQSRSFDTAGLFAAEADVFSRVGEVVLPAAAPSGAEEILIADDAFAAADAPVREALAPALEAVRRAVGAARSLVVAAEGLRA